MWQTWNRYGKVLPDGQRQGAARLDALWSKASTKTPANNPDCYEDCYTGVPEKQKSPGVQGFSEYRYGDSNPGFRRERAAS